jgi:hypothetical protein
MASEIKVISLPLEDFKLEETVIINTSNPSASFSGYFQGRIQALNDLENQTAIDLDALAETLLQIANDSQSDVVKAAKILGYCQALPTMEMSMSLPGGKDDGKQGVRQATRRSKPKTFLAKLFSKSR